MRLVLSILLLLVFAPGWAGEPQLPLPRPDLRIRAAGWVPQGGWPARIGALEPVGAIELSSPDPAFGGFSALVLAGGQATMLSDGGYTLSIMIRGGRVRRTHVALLRDGPREGWSRDDRDTESLTRDPSTGRWWVGYENANAVWRYTRDFHHAQAHAHHFRLRQPHVQLRGQLPGHECRRIHALDGLLAAHGQIGPRHFRGHALVRPRVRHLVRALALLPKPGNHLLKRQRRHITQPAHAQFLQLGHKFRRKPQRSLRG